jgi:hypothetical protein
MRCLLMYPNAGFRGADMPCSAQAQHTQAQVRQQLCVLYMYRLYVLLAAHN